MKIKNIQRVIKLAPTRVRRSYTGGLLLDQLQGIIPPADGVRPESWIASAVGALNDLEEGAGLSRVANAKPLFTFLKEYLEHYPEELLGIEHTQTYGSSMAYLAKLIDCNIRLSVQTHPDNAKAQEYFNSPFGKTEAWYIVDTRRIANEEPCIYLGFKPGITKKDWIRWIEEQNIPAMLASLHKIPVKKGDVYMVESGTPHAIGPGCFIAEIQEPTDYTLRVEKVGDESEYPDEYYHFGIGWEKMYECFHYDGVEYEELLSRIKIPSSIKRETEQGRLQQLLGSPHTNRFAMDRLVVESGDFTFEMHSFCSAIILKGEGALTTAGEKLAIKYSDELFLPAHLGTTTWSVDTGKTLEVLLFYPPQK